MLDIDLSTVLWQMFNFLVLAVALYYLLFKPVIKNLKAREEEKTRLMTKLAEEEQEVAALRKELESRIQCAEEESADIINAAQVRAEEERSALLLETQAEVERIITEAQVDAYRMKHQAVDEYHDELLGAVLDVSGLVIGRLAPDELNSDMVKQVTDSIWELGRKEMQRVDTLRRSLGDRTPTVVARSARALTPEQQGLLVRTFSALADRNINLDLKVEPSLGLGLHIRIGDLVIDNTIAGRLDEMRDSVMEALKGKISDDTSGAD